MKELLGSKKFWMSVIALVLMILNEIVTQINVEEMLAIISPFLAYILGQGIADLGKGKAEIEK